MQASDEKISLIFLIVKKTKSQSFQLQVFNSERTKNVYECVCTWHHTKLFLAPLHCQCCRRHCTRGVTDPWQATSALLGLVRELAQAPHASQCSILVVLSWRYLLLTGQNISCFCLLCKIKGSMGGKRIPSRDRIFVACRGKIHQAINVLLHKSWVPRNWS